MDMRKSSRSKKRATVFVTLVAGGIFILAAGLIPLLVQAQDTALNSVDPVLPPTTMQSPAPQLSLSNVNGAQDSLAAYRGKVILVNNWATWCPPCKIEMPELQAYYSVHASQGFTIVAIESGEPQSEVMGFVKQQGLTFAVWLDPKGSALDAFNNWNLPSSYVIDREGTIRLSWTGGVNQATLEKYVTPLLEEGQ